jgi:hypothetical protein
MAFRESDWANRVRKKVQVEMKTASLECQIAGEQLKRYLGGAKLSPELVRGLERHLASCPDCLATARKGRHPEAGKPVSKTAPKTKKMPGFALVDSAKAAVSKPLADKKKATTRTAVLGGLLVMTLIAMSAISRNPEGMLGKRAIAVEAAVPKPEPVSEAKPIEVAPEPMKGEAMPMAAVDQPVVKTPEPSVTPPKPALQAKPIVHTSVAPKTVSHPVNRRPIRRASTPRKTPAKPKSDSGSIRVYDASGRLVNPK